MKDKSGKSLLKYFGGLENLNIDWKAKEARMKKFRDSFNKRIAETRKNMEQSRNDRKNEGKRFINNINSSPS